MCNGLEGLFLALVEIDPCEMAKGTITECILDHPFNSTQRAQPPSSASYPNNCLTLLFNIGGTQTLTHSLPQSLQMVYYSTIVFFCPKNVGRVVKKKMLTVKG